MEAKDNKYVRTAKKIKLFRYFVLVFLVLFLLAVLSTFKDEITVENFRYLIKYIDVKPPDIGLGAKQIVFDLNSSMQTGVFKDDLVVLSKTALKLYDSSGRSVFSDNVSMSNPAFAVSGRYIIVYDIGAKYLAVYNVFSKLWEQTFEYPIYDVDVNENGAFCVATAAKGYHSAVYVYNNNFKKVYIWRSADKYVVDTAMHPTDNTKLAIACLKAVDGDFTSELISLSTKSDSVTGIREYPGEMSIQVDITEKNQYIYLTDRSLKFIDNESGAATEYAFVSQSLKNFVVTERYITLALNENLIGNTYTVAVFDPGGAELFKTAVESNITDIDAADDGVYILSVENLYKIAPGQQTVETFEADRGYRSVFALGGDSLFLVSDGSASAVNLVRKE